MSYDDYQMPDHVENAVAAYNEIVSRRVQAERDEARHAIRALCLFISSAAPGTTSFTVETDHDGDPMHVRLSSITPAGDDEGIALYPDEFDVPSAGPTRTWLRWSDEFAADQHFMVAYKDYPDVLTFTIERLLDLTRSRLDAR